MAPRQVFPYDECGTLRTRQQFLVDGSDLAGWQQEQQPKEQWLDISLPTELEKVPPVGDSSLIITRAAWEQQRHAQPAIDDLHDALNDDDDDDDDHGDAESVDLASKWANRELVPKRGVEIFVGGLTRSTRRDMLRDWFQHAGEVTEVRIARDKRRRRCRGYGYVRFATSEEANRAIETMHRYEFKLGRFLGVLPSDENRTLFVGGLREEWSCDYICQLLKEKMPGLRKVEPIPDREDRFKIRTFCFLEFESHADAAVIFNRHLASPVLSAPSQQCQQETTSPSVPLGPQMDLELLVPSSSTIGNETGGGGGGGGCFFERESRALSLSTCTSCCTSNGGGECGCGCGDRCRVGSAATSTTCPTSGSPDLRCDGVAGGDGDGDVLRYESSGLSSGAWGWPHLGLEDNYTHGGSEGGGNIGLFSQSNSAPAPATRPTGGIDSNGADGSSRVGIGGVEEAGSRPDGTVPLVVGGATLKVDWADPLRYHIHLNGGIKGPSAPPDLGMADGRPPQRGGGGGRSGTGMGGGASRRGGGFVGGASWQHQSPHQQQSLARHPSGPPLSDHRWQDGDPARMMHGSHRQRQHHQQHRQRQLRHQQQQHHRQHQHQQSATDGFSCHHPPHMSYNARSSAVATRERGYTIASGSISRRSPFYDGMGGGAGGRAEAVADSLEDRPRSKSSTSSHHYHTASHHHYTPQINFVRTGGAGAADYDDDGGYTRVTTPPAHQLHQRHEHVRRQPHSHPHRALVGGPGELQPQYNPRMEDSVLSSGFRPQQHTSEITAVGASGCSTGLGGGRQGSPMEHHHHRGGGGGDGGGAAARSAGNGRPFSASPDVPRGRRGSIEAFSSNENGSGDGRGDYDLPLSRSASCHPYSERQQQQQQHSRGGSGGGGGGGGSSDGRRGSVLSLSSSVGAAAGLPVPPCHVALDWSGVSDVGGDAQAVETSVFGGQGSRQQQNQQWDQQRVCERAIVASGPARPKDLAPAPTDGGVSGRSGCGALNSRINTHDPAGFAALQRRLDQQQQQQQPARCSNSVDSVAVAASLNPPARRHSSSQGLVFGLGDVGTHTMNDNLLPQGFSGGRCVDGGDGGVDISDRWADTSDGFRSALHAQQKQMPPGENVGSTWGAPLLVPDNRGAAAATATAAEDSTRMHISTDLWESIGARGLDSRR